MALTKLTNKGAVSNVALVAMLKAEGYSGNYGYFKRGFEYKEEGYVGITVDNEIWIYVGDGAPNKVVSAGTVPSVGAGYKQVVFNASWIYTLNEAKLTNLEVGQVFTVKDRNMANYEVMSVGMVPNGLDLIPLADGLTGQYIVEDGDINPQDIGAKEGADNASITGAAINRSIKLAISLSEPYPSVTLGCGDYHTDEEIDRSGSGNYVDFGGKGQRNTILRAASGSELNSVLKLANSGDVTGRTKINNMTIIAGEDANYCIDSKEIRYWTQDNLELIGGKVACQIAGNWVVKLNNTRFVGRVGLRHEGADPYATSSNNFVVNGGDFTQCSIGVHTIDGTNELTLNGCNFDSVDIAAYKCEAGIRNLKILGGCTFEATGFGQYRTSLTSSINDTQTTITVTNASSAPASGLLVIDTEEMTYTKNGNTLTVTRGTSGTVAKSHSLERTVKFIKDEGLHLVQVGSSTFEAAIAPIVCGYIYNNLGQTITKGSVTQSNFNNTSYESAVILYNCERFIFDGTNEFLTGYTHDSIIELRGAGCTDSVSYGIDINGDYPNVNRLVNLDNVSPSQASNIKADHKPKGSGSQSRFIVTDPTSEAFTPVTTAPTIIKSSLNGFDEYTFDSQTDGSTLQTEVDIDFSSDPKHPLLGRYISINYMTKGVSSSSGVWCRVYLDGVEAVSISRSYSSYDSAGRGQTLYIPKDAQRLRINLRAISASVSASMYGFKICDSSLI